MKNKKISYVEALRRTVRALKLYWKYCPGAALAILTEDLLKGLGPYVTVWFSARLVAELSGARDPHALLVDVLWILGSTAVLMLAQGLTTRWKNAATDLSDIASDKLYMEKMTSLDFPDMDSQHVYDLWSVIWQTQNFQGYGLLYLRFSLQSLPTALFQIGGGIGLTVSLFASRVPSGPMTVLNSPLFAVLLAAGMVLTALLSSFLSSKADGYMVRLNDQGRFGNRLFSFYGFMGRDPKRAPDLRMYNQQQNVCDPQMASKENNVFGPGGLADKFSKGGYGVLQAFSVSVSALITGVIYLFVCLKAWGGAFGLGAVTQYIGAGTNLFLGVVELLKGFGQLRANAMFLEPLFELLDMPNKMYQGSLTTEKRSDRNYEIEFRDVSFRYPGSNTDALSHVNLKFRVGSRLAVVGRNGSGKTTFIKLLCRLYDPTEGQILLNGIDIRKYRYDEYMDIFSVVFQDYQLLALPLGENVAAGTVYDREKVAECLKKAGFGDRLAKMPKGLDTYLYKELAEDGVEVSGGEAQKIAIARALYKDAPFIVLDEPTAALDPIAEAEIYGKFSEITGDKTAIYISHRLSSCKFCDEIAVFDEGRVVQQGTHEALLADEQGRYHALWTAQAQYYTEFEETPA